MKLYGVVGWKNAGKTTLVERLVAEIVGRGVSVSTLKHAHHAFDIDHEGKDSWRHRRAGARQVLVGSRARWALMTELRGAPEPDLATLLAKLDPVDLVLIEGFKGEAHPKLEVRRAAAKAPPIAPEDPAVRAIAADTPVPESGLPAFDLDAIGAIADFVLGDCGLAARVGPAGGAAR